MKPTEAIESTKPIESTESAELMKKPKRIKTVNEIVCNKCERPTRGLRQLILMAQDELPPEERHNLYAIARKFDELVTTRYGANKKELEGKLNEDDDHSDYQVQLGRMYIHSTHDLLARIRYILFR